MTGDQPGAHTVHSGPREPVDGGAADPLQTVPADPAENGPATDPGQTGPTDTARSDGGVSALPSHDLALALREPAHRVSPKAVPYWRVNALIGLVFQLAILGAAYVFIWDDKPWWATTVLVLAVVAGLVHLVAMPIFRFRVHRWEITPAAVFTRSGWLSLDQRIAPLSRVQTVDSKQGALMRAFGLASITVTTASAAGPITIDCLDRDVAERVVAELTAITGSTEGDAT